MYLLSRWHLLLLSALTPVYLFGCSATTIFTSYPAKIEPLKALAAPVEPQNFELLLASERSSNDKILYNLEHGRLAQVLGYTETSQSSFSVAINAVRENEQRATVSASRIGSNLAAIMTNDNALPYEGEGYERVLLHHYQALNYLLQNNLEGAGVEFRWANTEQNEALLRHEKELTKAEEKSKDGSFDGNALENPAIQQQYAQLNEVAGRVKNSFQNAYSFYLSGLIYELQGEANDAYIDYKKALEIYPDNRYLQKSVITLAKKLAMSDDLLELERRFPQTVAGMSHNKNNMDDSGEIILLFEDGYVPPREELNISFPLASGLTTLALPFYRVGWSDPLPLELQIDGQTVEVSSPICDVRVLAVKSLQEKMPIILTRQLIRAVAKAVAQKEAKDRLGPMGQLGMMAFSLVSERADLRSWLTLPENVQILRAKLPAGQQTLNLSQQGTLSTISADVEVKAKGKTILYVVKRGGQFHLSSIVF